MQEIEVGAAEGLISSCLCAAAAALCTTQVLYLSDVYDHISTVVEDMISLAEDAKDLIDLVSE